MENENENSVSFIGDMIIIKCDNLYQARRDGNICNIVTTIRDDFLEIFEFKRKILNTIVIVDANTKRDYFERKITNLVTIKGTNTFVISWQDIQRGFSFEKIMKIIEKDNLKY